MGVSAFSYFCTMHKPPSFSINCHGRLVDLTFPKIMGILNLTPDSFSDGGKFNEEDAALRQAEKLIAEGADFIDIGAQSTRPGAAFLFAKEEIRRLGAIISSIKKEFPETLISLDTFYAEVVKFGFDEGIDLVNDISGGDFDENLLNTVAETRLPYILMHSNANYSKMHEKVQYEDITYSLNRYFSKKILELQALGIDDIILDPGFGFGKTVEDQYKLIEDAGCIGFGSYPLLIGISRKSFIYKPLNKTPLEVGEETQVLHREVLQKGGKILRVHEVAETKKVVTEFTSR